MNKVIPTLTAFCFSAFVLFFYACEKKRSNISEEKNIEAGRIIPEILVDPAVAAKENATGFFKEIKFIKLESPGDNLISEIKKIVFSADRIYILDQFTKTIFIFESGGKFVTKIRNVSEGPGEYNNLKDFAVDSVKKELIIYDRSQRKFLFYDLDGKFKNEIRNGLFFDTFFLMENGVWALVSSSKSNGPPNFYNIFIYNKNGNQIVNKFLPFRNTALPRMIHTNNISVTDEGALFTYPFCDTLLSITEKGVVPKYFIHCEKFVDINDTKNYNMSTSEVYSKIETEGKHFKYSHLVETDEWIHFTYPIHQRVTHVYYSKRARKTLNIKNVVFDGVFYVFPHLTSYRGYFVSPADPQILFNLKEKLTGDIGAVAKSLSVNDNPVLILCKMK